METESAPSAKEGGSKDEKAEPGDKEENAESAEKKEPEPNFQLLSNPARVLPQQVSGPGSSTFLPSRVHPLSARIRSLKS